jgi:hypothetical protein
MGAIPQAEKYYESGQLKGEIYWKNGKEHGLMEEFNEDGLYYANNLDAATLAPPKRATANLDRGPSLMAQR